MRVVPMVAPVVLVVVVPRRLAPLLLRPALLLSLEALQALVGALQQLLQLGVELHVELGGDAAIVMERPELLQAVEAAALKVLRVRRRGVG
jgi:hypothetical protein